LGLVSAHDICSIDLIHTFPEGPIGCKLDKQPRVFQPLLVESLHDPVYIRLGSGGIAHNLRDWRDLLKVGCNNLANILS
jgi:hypothetical protein